MHVSRKIVIGIRILAFGIFSINRLVISATSPETPVLYSKADLMGMFEASSHAGFKRVPEKYASHGGHYLRNEVVDAYVRMAKKAEKDAINLEVISAFRSYYRQKTIWNNKFTRFHGTYRERSEKILEYSSMPGTSRHHWGTDFDLNSLEPAFFDTPNGKAIYDWLVKNAHEFGFFQPYKEYNAWRDAGYKEEKWHWSYAPTADRLLRAYRFLIKPSDIQGFLGSELAEELDVIERYVLCIEKVDEL
jgi:zinc D-Ala-D-Ala carboxypeptidase